MIFADKLIALRKKNGWSQEELAERMGVTRQAVSKWEGAQAVPDLERLLRLSQLFGVSTDYLLKDELETPEGAGVAQEPSLLRRVTMEEANRFLSVKARTARSIALGVLLCILSPICLFLLAALTERPSFPLSEGAAATVGLTVLLGMVTAAVAVFILAGSKTAPFRYLDEEPFETEYGVTGMARERQGKYRATYTAANLVGVCLCILSAVPLFFCTLFQETDLLPVTALLCATLAMAGAGVFVMIRVGIVWAGMEKLLQEGDYSRESKARRRVLGPLSTVYWLLAVAIFLGVSFLTDSWERTPLVLAVAGVGYPAVLAVARLLTRPKE